MAEPAAPESPSCICPTKDYRDNHLSSLVARYGSAGPLNGEVFNRLISQDPGQEQAPDGERIVVFSPHPDDDVISMGGTLRKLVENDNHITVGYQTSGQHRGLRPRGPALPGLRRARPPRSWSWPSTRPSTPPGGGRGGAPRQRASRRAWTSHDVLDLKRIIRETEAGERPGSGGARSRRTPASWTCPFYQTGKVRKDPITERDVGVCLDLLEETKPDHRVRRRRPVRPPRHPPHVPGGRRRGPWTPTAGPRRSSGCTGGLAGVAARRGGRARARCPPRS